MVSQSNGATQNVAAMQMSGFRHKRKAANSCAESGAEIFNVRFGKSVKAELLSFLTGRLSVKNGEGKVVTKKNSCSECKSASSFHSSKTSGKRERSML